jgi:hypothetical protein
MAKNIPTHGCGNRPTRGSLAGHQLPDRSFDDLIRPAKRATGILPMFRGGPSLSLNDLVRPLQQ